MLSDDAVNNAEVLSSIDSIYDRYSIPESLQMHMRRVAAVAELICNNLIDKTVDTRRVVATCLLHDMGNIVKFDFDNKSFTAKLLGSSGKDIEFYRELKESLIKKYGSDSEHATVKILEEIGIEQEIIKLVGLIGFKKANVTKETENFEAKICYYSDKRVGPFGVVSLAERFREGTGRYKDKLGFVDGQESEDLNKSSFEIEKQLMSHLKISSSQITDTAIEPYILKYKQKSRAI